MRQWREGSKGERSVIPYPDAVHVPTLSRTFPPTSDNPKVSPTLSLSSPPAQPHIRVSLYARRLYPVPIPSSDQVHPNPDPDPNPNPNPNPNPDQVHAWVQLHFRRLKQRQAALLGIPPHKFTSKL